jgi:hypothetical protein
VYVRIAVAFVLIVATGGLRPPLLYALRTFADEKTIFAMHKRTPKKSGGREPAVVVATHGQRKTNSLRMTSVRIRSGGRKPAVVVATHGQWKANSSRITSVVIRSGGREPAVGLVT